MKKSKVSSKLLAAAGLAVGLPMAAAADGFPGSVEFSTLITTELVVEGLIGDSAGNLYTPGRQAGAGQPCPVYRVNVGAPAVVVVGYVPAPSPTGQCSPSGLTFNKAGSLFIADGDKVYTLTPNAASPPVATVYATNVPGTNGVTFDDDGNLWTGDGTTGQGRVWKVPPGGGDGIEVFRIQPMRNSVDVGRQARTFPPGTATNTAGGQDLVANGLIFDRRGGLLVADTARGAIWRVEFGRHGELRSKVGCDTTFTDNTLCLDSVMVAHPYLEGADGIDLDRAGNIWVSVNERNSVAVVTRKGDVVEVFRNPPDATSQLRNGGPLEFPTSPFVLHRTVCTANSDGNRRDNSPNTAGEIGGPGQDRGKISCARLGH